MKQFYIFCFMMWGFFGLVASVGTGLYGPILTAIYAALMWLAGSVLFGFAVFLMEVVEKSSGTLVRNEVYVDR